MSEGSNLQLAYRCLARLSANARTRAQPLLRRGRAMGAVVLAGLVQCFLIPPLSAQHLGDMLVASAEKGRGALLALYDFRQPVQLSRTFAQGDIVFFTSITPGFDALISDDPSRSAYRLKDGTAVRVELVGVSPGASVKIGNRILDTVGASVTLGTMPNLHVHPEWRLLIAEGTTGEFWIEFKLSTTARGYSSSPPYRLRFALPTPEPTLTPSVVMRSPTPSFTAEPTATFTPTNTANSEPRWTPTSSATPTRQETTRTPTATPSPQPSPTPSSTPTAGIRSDFNCDGRVTAADIVAEIAAAVGATATFFPGEVCGQNPGPGHGFSRTIADLFSD